ncbi:TPA: HEPN domain-containing protein [Raoultella planticola]
MRIVDEYNKSGFFWLPDNEEVKIPGILSIKDGGKIELEIIGDFNDDFLSSNKIPRIIGHVEKDGLVTLDNCFYTRRNIAFGGISKSNIHAHKALCGAAWLPNEPVLFNTFSFEVDCLDEWVGISGINVEHDWENKTAKISYNPPEKIIITLDNGMSLEICFAYTLPGFPTHKEAKVTQRTYFKLDSKELRTLDEYTAIAYKITNLMCFAMDEIIAMKNVSATSSEIFEIISDNGKHFNRVNIFYQSISYSEKTPTRNPHEMLFTFWTIKDSAQEVFNNWINAYEFLNPAFNLYFSTKLGAHKYLEGKFLALAQGLETYHRRTSNETLMTTDAFESLVADILKSCPKENIEWLQGRLKNGNEINLGKRLKRIIEPFKQYFGTSSERNKILRKIVDTRNYLTHYNKDLEVTYAKGKDLLLLCYKMEAIFNLHFLNVLGFTDEEIKKVVSNCYPLKQKLQLKTL